MPGHRKAAVKLLLFVAGLVLTANFAVWGVLSRSGGRRPVPPPVKAVPGRPSSGAQICDAVDVVYTWVNGSDPAHKELLHKFGKSWDAGFRDYNTLRYSIRSVERFMPWARQVVIVTNGQVPGWANLSAPRLRVVRHDQIFPDLRHLPTFNSNAIEAHLHKIPGLAPCFLYMNDDMFLAREIPKDLHFDEHGNLRPHMSSGYVAPMYEKMRGNLWHRSVGTSNELISRYYYPNATDVTRHNYVSHTCYFMRKDILDTMYERWRPEFDKTSSHRFRQGDDTALPFMQANVALEEFGATPGKAQNIYGTWGSDHAKNVKFWSKVWTGENYCACMNDNLDSSPESAAEIDNLGRLFEQELPKPSSVEKRRAGD